MFRLHQTNDDDMDKTVFPEWDTEYLNHQPPYIPVVLYYHSMAELACRQAVTFWLGIDGDNNGTL